MRAVARSDRQDGSMSDDAKPREFVRTSLRGARFVEVDLTGAVVADFTA